MRSIRVRITTSLLCLFSATAAQAQPTQPTVPKLVRFSGSFRPANGQPSQPVEGVTLAVYRDQTGGEALWSEIQNVSVDAEGHYSVLMGATQSEGIPLDLFSSGEPRWLGAQFNRPGEAEQPRVLMASVPYALKSVDAETLGGRPASAYLLAAPTVGVGANSGTNTTSSATVTTPGKSTKASTPVSSGVANYIAMFTNGVDVGDSVVYQANGAIGIGTTVPGISLDVRTGSLPQLGVAGITDYLTFFASDTWGPAIYWDPAKDMRFGRGGSGIYNPYGFVEQMRIQSSTGNVGIGTAAPASKLDVTGDINFAGIVKYQGTQVLLANGQNLAVGLSALPNNTSGFGNTATGFAALSFNDVGYLNTASGVQALRVNTSGLDNTAVGAQSLYDNTSGNSNTGLGSAALFHNDVGSNNTALGFYALFQNTAGATNTAVGQQALQGNSTGSNNTALGYLAGAGISSGSSNIDIGNQAGNGVNDGSNNILIGNSGAYTDSGVIRIGTTGTQTSFYVAGVNGVTTTNSAVPVMIDTTNGQLGVTSSSRRYKENIEDMGAASYDLMRLRPVTYRYKKPFADGSKPIQYGLVAEEVAEVYPDLVAYSADGQVETVKYQVLDSMLLNEVQRQQAEIRGLAQQNQSLQERLAKLEAALASDH